MNYQEDVARGKDWTFYLGDSVKRVDEIESNSVGLSVFSPPFPGMYVYTNSEHDMGNVQSVEDMVEHFRYLMGKDKLLRIMMPGRHAMIHLTQGVAQKGRDGYIGLKDFRGSVIRMMEGEGWIYYGEIAIQKNPQVKAIRTKDRGLMFKTLANDSSHMHVALADYVLQFRKPGENLYPIRAGISTKYDNPDGWITNEEWIEWAHPIWTDINETNVLNVTQARDTNDERHLCPLQLDVIERCIKLWSNPGEVVFSPFGGIGSEGYMALKLKRKAILVELKESYWKSGIANLERASQESSQKTLFDLMIGEEL
ncbi:MAG: site-specific DNA-methyltransferase [Pyrinomonadaceae bacterium]|nr:site-specific DNA-methyltransferase [Pyrinomonadaceae bacterium]